MTPVAGKEHTQRAILGIQPGQDTDGFYQDQLVEFADNHGWARGLVCYWWSRITEARIDCGQEQDIAEDAALHDAFAAFRDLKIGREPD